jgi:hypothetical protein
LLHLIDYHWVQDASQLTIPRSTAKVLYRFAACLRSHAHSTAETASIPMKSIQ